MIFFSSTKFKKNVTDVCVEGEGTEQGLRRVSLAMSPGERIRVNVAFARHVHTDADPSLPIAPCSNCNVQFG